MAKVMLFQTKLSHIQPISILAGTGKFLDLLHYVIFLERKFDVIGLKRRCPGVACHNLA